MAKKSFSFDRIVNKPKPTPQKKAIATEPIKEVEVKAKEEPKPKKVEKAAPTATKTTEKPVAMAKSVKPKSGKRKYDIREGKQKIDKDLVNSVGRKKFTTMIRPDLRNLLDNIAHNNNISVAQLLEDILDEYFGND